MPDLSAAAGIDLWQAADQRDPIERTLLLAAAAGGEDGSGELARLPVGRRDARLLALHETLAGGVLEATARCPACGEQAELDVEVEALRARGAEPPPPVPLETAGHVVAWRSPDSLDVAAAAAAGDVAAAERVLLERCVTAAAGPEGEVQATELPAAVREVLARALAEADPLAEVLIDLSCPGCDAGFVAELDLGAFVWAELRTHAQRLLREVDALARAYGWSEAEVLALDGRRRAAYLELALGAAR